jgi:hypothetical protein
MFCPSCPQVPEQPALPGMQWNAAVEASTPLRPNVEPTPLASPTLPNLPSVPTVEPSVMDAPANAERSRGVVHGGVACDVCHCVIEGIRHKCLDCAGKDRCFFLFFTTRLSLCIQITTSVPLASHLDLQSDTIHSTSSLRFMNQAVSLFTLCRAVMEKDRKPRNPLLVALRSSKIPTFQRFIPLLAIYATRVFAVTDM